MPTAFSTETLVVTRLAWAHGIPYTLPERNVSRGNPLVARRRAPHVYSSQPLASAQETAHGRAPHVRTLC